MLARIQNLGLRFRWVSAGLVALSAPFSVFAQTAPPALKASPPSGNMDMSGMDTAGMNMPGMEMSGMAMTGDLGAYPMTRDASGTSWQPDSAPMEGLHRQLGDWSTMLHGYGTLVYDDQGGSRGADKTFFESMLMGMGQRPLDGGTLTLRAMVSLDPLMGSNGYPLLLQTGETANGRTALVDRQHPHNAVMELGAIYSHPISKAVSTFLYVAWPGEPALGPVTFMHRFSGDMDPAAPITHHWLDSTHTSSGVVTLGVTDGPFKLETSSFTGREPNQNRGNIDHPTFDSWSSRATVNPTANLSFQVSAGWLHSPEQLTPNVDQWRTTASGTYNLPLPKGNWQTLLAWGRDRNMPGNRLDAVLFESAASYGRDTVFFRTEYAQKDELFDDDPTSPLFGRVFDVVEYTTGYFRTFPLARSLVFDAGGLFSRYTLPTSLNSTYGSDPVSFMLFTRVRID
jgi:hypothetical protein